VPKTITKPYFSEKLTNDTEKLMKIKTVLSGRTKFEETNFEKKKRKKT